MFAYSGVQHILFCFSLPCVLEVASFSGLFIFDCPFGILSHLLIIPPLHRRGGVYCFTSVRPSVLPSVCLSFRPSKIFFVAFFSATIAGRKLIFGHKLHIGTPYRGKRFLTRQIPTSCLPKSGGIIGEH